jgi:DNA-directed RNA polymerase specialized sigma24 family protein
MTTERAPAVSPETPDQRLHQELLVQAPGAVEALVHRYGVKIYRLALRITGNTEDAQEVSQDVLWTIVRKIGTFKGESALGSWIYRITANAAYEKLRSRRGKDEVLGGVSRVRPRRSSGRAGARLDPAGGGPRAPGRARRRLRDAIETCPRITGPRSCSTTWKGSRTRRSPRCSRSACRR